MGASFFWKQKVEVPEARNSKPGVWRNEIYWVNDINPLMHNVPKWSDTL